MIWLTGDTHCGADMRKLESKYYLEQQGVSFAQGDYLIILGDFGFPFLISDVEEYERSGGTAGKYSRYMQWFSKQPYTVLFVDGNHENHDWWSRQEVTEMYGGRVQVHPHAPNVVHLMRGEIYTIEGKKFFAFGGAYSIDKQWRIEGTSWWREEEASLDEIKNALDNLEREGNRVDHILTHTMPMGLIDGMVQNGMRAFPCRTAEFLDTVLERVEYGSWYCGHFHVDTDLEEKRLHILYNRILPLE